ncbi:hypothetical protein GCM10027073_29860 [Streptomyces chlorus]
MSAAGLSSDAASTSTTVSPGTAIPMPRPDSAAANAPDKANVTGSGAEDDTSRKSFSQDIACMHPHRMRPPDVTARACPTVTEIPETPRRSHRRSCAVRSRRTALRGEFRHAGLRPDFGKFRKSRYPERATPWGEAGSPCRIGYGSARVDKSSHCRAVRPRAVRKTRADQLLADNETGRQNEKERTVKGTTAGRRGICSWLPDSFVHMLGNRCNGRQGK